MESVAGQENAPDRGSTQATAQRKWDVELGEAPAFSVAIGQRLQEVREARGSTAEEVAQTAQRLGLSWHRPTVGQIEKGKRGITAVELLLLPLLYGKPLRELLPAEMSRLTDQVAAGSEGIMHLLDQGAETKWSDLKRPGWFCIRPVEELDLEAVFDLATRMAGRERAMWPDSGDLRRDFMIQPDEAEAKAAKRLATTPEYVAYTSREVWGRGLTAEREARLAERSSVPNTSRALQSARGHITRALIAELEPVIREYEMRRLDPEGPWTWVPPAGAAQPEENETEGEGPGADGGDQEDHAQER
ncbi:helix-turn-helix transcriptional regulator [Streptomyces sp. SID8499]|uniref:helix-turn-helix domain-containing protein n=1 Tax=Streptomyces sp. SID8499 TaxID=2706106 RepID=UPI0013CBF472|nr:helix-turn-helix transcriptional regulator [Streptomyces sp. SID8499]NED35565.1 helix-turn-helix transcriptional regulator [Streptomyces sp. SID8499]